MVKIKFRTKLIIIFVAVLLLQGMIIGFFSYYYAESIVMKNKQRDMADMVNLVDININVRVRACTELIEKTADSQSIKKIFLNEKSDPVFLNEFFGSISSAFGAANHIILADQEKVVFGYGWNNDSLTIEDDFASLEAFATALEKPEKTNWLGISDSLINDGSAPDSDNQVITISKAVLDDDAKPLGVLIVELDPTNFSSLLLNSSNTFQSQYTFIIDKKQDIICSNKIVNEAWVELISEQFENGVRKFEMEWAGQSYYVCGQYNGITGWKTFSVIATDSIFPQTEILKRFIFISVALCTCCISLIIMAISYTMTRPINKLHHAMKEVWEGDFSIRLNSRHKDEMGMLMNSFDFMVDKINALVNEVYQEKIAQKNAEMEALEAQINPHFLYNTLDSINWMLIDKEEYEISEVIISLGNLLKYCVDKTNGIVKLEQELEYVISYLLIQKTRLEDKLNYEINIPEHLKSIKVPKLILQPLIENAIIHGIEPQKNGGRVKISATEDSGHLYLSIEDNGCGMAPQRLRAFTNSLGKNSDCQTSIGVYNVDKRLRLRYGNDYGLNIQSVLQKGTLITIKIPKISQEDTQ